MQQLYISTYLNVQLLHPFTGEIFQLTNKEEIRHSEKNVNVSQLILKRENIIKQYF